MNRTLERIKRVPLAITFDDKRFVVIVAANFAFHGDLLPMAFRRKGNAGLPKAVTRGTAAGEPFAASPSPIDKGPQGHDN